MIALPRQRKEAAPTVSEKRLRLWNALRNFVHENGGAVVSVPGHKTMRIEVRKGSAIPAKLIAAGHHPYQCGSTTRIEGGRFAAVDIIEIDLPVK
jgi:hypothetical protein